MSRFQTLAAGAVMLSLVSIPAGADAAVITQTFVFSATYDPTAPFSSVSGSATVSFDLAVSQSVTPLPSFSSTLPASFGPFSFVYNAGPRQVIFGNNCGGTTGTTCAVQAGTNEVSLAFVLDPAGFPNGQNPSLPYSTIGSNGIFNSTALIMTTTIGVPEPPSLTLLTAATISLLLVRRRRS